MISGNAQARDSNLRTRARLDPERLLLAALFALMMIAAPPSWTQTFTVLHKFSGAAGGLIPPAGVVVDNEGNSYGVTNYGGAFNFGVVYKLDPSGKETVLHNFWGGDGLGPNAALIWGTDGVLYGTTSDGGSPEGGKCKHGCGEVFAIDTTGKVSVVYAFKGGTDGAHPGSRLVRDQDGNLYGTTFFGGDLSCYVGGCGVVFKVDKNGKQTVLYAFTDHADGKMPLGLLRDNRGNLYGTTYDGGTSGDGAVFKLSTAGKLTVLYSFTAGTDSAYPDGVFIRDRSGNLYGTTSGVGTHDYGIAFKLSATGKLTVLHSFSGGNDGQYPGTLVADKNGNIYGTTMGGGKSSGCYYGGCGVVFKLDVKHKETVLHNFTGTDGELPNGLILDAAGNFYGTTLGGGAQSKACPDNQYYHGCGTVFKLSP